MLVTRSSVVRVAALNRATEETLWPIPFEQEPGKKQLSDTLKKDGHCECWRQRPFTNQQQGYLLTAPFDETPNANVSNRQIRIAK